MPADLRRHLEDHELVGPGGGAALSTAVIELAGDRHQRGRRGLMCKLIELGASEPQSEATPIHLGACDLQQQLMQSGRGRFLLWPAASERAQPLSRLAI